MQLAYNPLRDDQFITPDFAYCILDWINRDCPDVRDVLDLGMGEGYLVKLLRESGKNAYGADVRAMGQERLIIADARALPFKDNSFDLVTEFFFLSDLLDLQNLPEAELERVIEETRRVLRPGGFFMTIPSTHLAYSFFNKFDKELYGNSPWGLFRK